MSNICPVCYFESCVPYGDVEWTVDSVTYRLVQCPKCACVHTDPLPRDAVLKRLYATSFDYRWYQDHYDVKLRDCQERIKEYLPYLGARVLDYGGGLGYFSKAAIEMGLESVTYDPYVGDRQQPNGEWNSVVALHMLEHSNDLDNTISHMKAFLVPGGRLILAVPNFEGAGYQQLGMRWVWAQPPLVHIFHFTARGLVSLLERHGFKNIQVTYSERWDANNYCDVAHVKWYTRCDRAWGNQRMNRFQAYRALIARINSWQRHRGLQRALHRYDPSDSGYSELQVISELA